MKTIAYYLRQLLILRDRLISYLREKNLDCDDNETYNTLIPKIQMVTVPATNKQSLDDYSLTGCDLSEERLNDLISKLNLTNPSTDISYKFSDVPNLKTLALKDFNITNVTKATGYLNNTPLVHLDLSGVTTSISDLVGRTSSSGNSNTLPRTIESIDFSNATMNFTDIGFYQLSNLKELKGLETCSFPKGIASLTYFAAYTALEEIDLTHLPLNLSTDGVFNLNYLAYQAKELHTFNMGNYGWSTMSGVNLNNAFSYTKLTTYIGPPMTAANKISNLNYTFYKVPITDELLESIGILHADWSVVTNFESTFADTVTTVDGVTVYNESLKQFDLSETKITTFPNLAGVLNGRSLEKISINNLTLAMNTPGGIIGTSLKVGELSLDGCTFTSTNKSIDSYTGLLSYGFLSGTKNLGSISLKNVLMPANNVQALGQTSDLEEIDLSEMTIYNPEIWADRTEIYFPLIRVCYKSNVKRFIGPKNVVNAERGLFTTTPMGYGGFAYCYNLEYLDISNFDFSEAYIMGSSSSGACPFSESKKLETVIWGTNIGKGYNNSTSSSYKKIYLHKCTSLSKESVMDLFNKVYDLNLTFDVANGGTLKPATIDLPTHILNVLTPEEIAIATNKGWTVI